MSPKLFSLAGEKFLLTDELQHGQEQPDDLAAGGSAFEDLAEGHRPVAAEAVEEVVGVEFDGGVVVDNLLIAEVLADGGHEAVERVEQVPDLGVLQVDLRFGGQVFVGGAGASGGRASSTVGELSIAAGS